MKNNIRTLALLGSILAVGATVQAQNIVGSTGSDAAWNGALVYQTGLTPQTGSGGNTLDNDSWGGDVNGVGGYGALGQAFEVTSSGTLASAELDMAGAAATFDVELYNMGAAPANWPSATVGGAPTITQFNNLGGVAGSFSGATGTGGLDLLAAGDQFTFAGVVSGTTLQTLTFGGADSSVSLIAGDVYILSLDPVTNSPSANGTWWVRGGVPVTGYNTGEGLNADGVAGMQNFEGKSTIRDFDLAITETPEPASMALLGLGGLVGTFMFRRQRK
jgi:hypothetical protein